MDPNNGTLPRQIYSVAKLTTNIKRLLEDKFAMVWICGEISNLRIPSSGHAYFTLKDDKAQIAAVMFRGQLRRLRFDLDDGLTIIAMGRITVYEPRGNYQIVLEYAEPKGAGALQLAFEQLKAKLAAEGLFDERHKQPLPFMPRTIAVITSPTGAVIRDILHVIGRRFPNVRVEVLPVRVQGDAAPAEIVRALRIANVRARADVIVLARGGGSLEDLAPFNAEAVARAVFDSRIPVVSAVGHETDFTIADFVADVRAPTPSAAAELVVPVKAELRRHHVLLAQRMAGAMMRMATRWRERLDRANRSMVHPIRKVQENRLRLDDWTERLQRAVRHILQNRRTATAQADHRLQRGNPMVMVRERRQRVEMLAFRLTRGMDGQVAACKGRLAAGHAALDALSPRSVLRRGYSITRKVNTQIVVTYSDSVHSGEPLEVILARGRLQVTVDRIED
ncbi:exodeoxyribonuclease VII large subunit [Desulfatitalea alkaliphila]|nr:exodeoxyribonuclease VII large subunit [Desulfatitalea alkaliphila]